jgi:Ti-type conjugative transfer relaxase TraA
VLPRIEKGRGLSGAVRYVMGQGKGRGNDWQPGMDSRVDWISGQNFGFAINTRQDVEDARRIMEFMAQHQSSRTRRCEDDVMHLSLSWHPTEQPTREQMEEAARDALKALGMEEARAIFVAHNDTDVSHVHIVASRIHPETGRAIDALGDFIKIDAWALEYERQQGVIRCPAREAIDPRDHEKILEALTARNATFTRRELERLINKSVVSRLEVRTLVNDILVRDNVIGLKETPGGPTVRYTTREVLAHEAEILQDAGQLKRSTAHGMTEHVRQHMLDRYAHLDHEQRLAFAHATDPEGLALIAGQAGSGKSTTLEAVREAYREAGYRVIGLSLTNSVVNGMKQDGFAEIATIAGEMKRQEAGLRRWTSRTVLIVDEAAMLSTAQMADLTARAREAQAKLILVGDERQLSSIERGGMFEALRQEHGAAELRQVRRVADIEQKFAWNRMHEGDFAQALGIFEKQGAIHWTGTQNEARDALIAQYAGDSAREPERQRFVFAFTNADVNALNQDIRALRRERGELGEDHILQTKDGAQMFAPGDRIQFTGNAKTQRTRNLGFTNGQAATITKIEGARVTVELDGDKRDSKPGVREFTVGDNAEAGQFNSIRHGYAGTIYKGQGKTLDQTYLYHSEHWRGAASYVALTRHREHTKVFVARETAADINQLAKQMARSDERRAASQFHYERGIERSEEGRNTEGEQDRAAERRRVRDLFLEPQRPGPDIGAGPERKRDRGLER